MIKPEHYELFCKGINELTSGEATVTVANSNPDFDGPNELLICSGDWTDWANQYFGGDTKIECIEAAVAAKRSWPECQ